MKKVLAVVAAMVLLSGCGAKKPQGGLKNASYAGCEYLQDADREFECFNNTLASYLADEYKYPEAARSLGVEGKIYVNFVVESDGSISNVKVVKGLDALLDAEAIRAVRALPTMIPATYDGRPVRIPVYHSNQCQLKIIGPSLPTLRPECSKFTDSRWTKHNASKESTTKPTCAWQKSGRNSVIATAKKWAR